MEPRSEVEMMAVYRAGRVAKREKLRRQAEGMGHWTWPATLAVGAIYLIGAGIEGHAAQWSILAALLFLAAIAAHGHSRMDAIVALLPEDPSVASDEIMPVS